MKVHRPYHIDPEQVITYSLRGYETNSNQYYQIIKSFSDEVFLHGCQILDFCLGEQNEGAKRESVRELQDEESIFTLLLFGVLWMVYGVAVEKSRRAKTGSRNSRCRQPPTASLIFSRRPARTICQPPSGFGSGVGPMQTPGEDNLKLWLGWLDKTGELSPEVERLSELCAQLMRLPSPQRDSFFSAILQFAAWFETRSLEVLGGFTQRVEPFLNEAVARYRWREDAFFCSRRRVEYHLYMVGTELLNRAYRQAFLATSGTVILLPPCMRLPPTHQCQAEREHMERRCVGCTPGCRIHHVSCLGRKRSCTPLILEGDLSRFTHHMVRDFREAKLGVIGISCALTNAPGGLAASSVGIPAQGVLLDYCGCSWHWHEKGIPTDVNFKELIAILDRHLVESKTGNLVNLTTNERSPS